MGRVRFVKPESVKLPLSDNDWIEVKKRLTVGEARHAMSSFIGKFNSDGSRTPNLDVLGMGQVLAYVVDWSFVDEHDKRVPVSLDTLKALDTESYAEIERAIEAHIQSQEPDEKNAPSTLSASGLIS